MSVLKTNTLQYDIILATSMFLNAMATHLHAPKKTEKRKKLAMTDKRLYTILDLSDPALGRFLNPDPEVQLPDNTQSYNRYSYCLNNPLRYNDPTGEVIRTYVNGKPYDYKMGKDGTFGFYNNADELYDGPDSFVFDLTMALQEIQSGDLGLSMVSHYGRIILII